MGYARRRAQNGRIRTGIESGSALGSHRRTTSSSGPERISRQGRRSLKERARWATASPCSWANPVARRGGDRVRSPRSFSSPTRSPAPRRVEDERNRRLRDRRMHALDGSMRRALLALAPDPCCSPQAGPTRQCADSRRCIGIVAVAAPGTQRSRRPARALGFGRLRKSGRAAAGRCTAAAFESGPLAQRAASS